MIGTEATTAFANWLDANDLTTEEAAAALGLTRQMIRYLEQGHDSGGRPVTPKMQTRKLMQAISEGHVFEPYPV